MDVLVVAERLDVLLLDLANFELLDIRHFFRQQLLFVEVGQIDVLSFETFKVIMNVHNSALQGPDNFLVDQRFFKLLWMLLMTAGIVVVENG